MLDQELHIRRKKLLYRCIHRGTKEADNIIGVFAKEHVPSMDKNEMDQFEELLTESDIDLFYWLTGQKPLPANKHYQPLMKKMIAWNIK